MMYYAAAILGLILFVLIGAIVHWIFGCDLIVSIQTAILCGIFLECGASLTELSQRK